MEQMLRRRIFKRISLKWLWTSTASIGPATYRWWAWC